MTGMQIRPRPRCLERATFDIWAMQPYTWGGPTHHAEVEGDLALGDLPVMKQVLDDAVATGRIVSNEDVRFWVTEFSWDTKPPDANGVPMDLHMRWTAHALYVMWQSGVSLVTWFLITDRPAPERWQSGLYFGASTIAEAAPKPMMKAFRFPAVAFVEPGGIRVWARTPGGAPGAVRFSFNDDSELATLSTDSHGIATGLVPSTVTQGFVHATFLTTGEFSLPFSLTEVPDQEIDPFGD
jgi:hypothetical protein